MNAAVPWNEGPVPLVGPKVFLCDSVAWRLEPFVEAIGRVLAEARRLGCSGVVTLGYRARDDVAFLGVPDCDQADAARILDAALLPGLRILHVPGGPEATKRLLEQATRTFDTLIPLDDFSQARHALRSVLGLDTDPRANVRLSCRLALRYAGPDGGWVHASTRDVAAGGVFVEVDGPPPPVGTSLALELWLPDEHFAVSGRLLVVRHAPEGFGARLELGEAELSRVARAVRRLRPPPTEDSRRTTQRVPARYIVRFATGEDLARAYTVNLSKGGVFIRTQSPPERGAHVRLGLAIPEGVELEVWGTVAHVVTQGSTPGFGLTFDRLDDADREKLEGTIAALIARPKARALVADGAGPYREKLSDALRQRSCETLEAGTSEDAIRRLTEEILLLDVLIIGPHLPGESAADLVQRVRVDGGESALPLIVVSRTPDEEHGGASLVLDRGSTPEHVADAVLRLAETGPREFA